MLFLRALRLDASDEQVYARTAQPGEWAIPGSFTFLVDEPDTGPAAQTEAFRHAFVGTMSFGYTSLVEIAEISAGELQGVANRLSQHLLTHYGAPSEREARQAADEEIGFTLELCTHAAGTLIAIERIAQETGIEERFRVVEPTGGVDHGNIRLWGSEDGR